MIRIRIIEMEFINELLSRTISPEPTLARLHWLPVRELKSLGLGFGFTEFT